MILYSNHDNNIESVSEEDIIYYGNQLEKFLTIYKTNVLITDPEHVKIIHQLEEYLWRIKNKRYDMLIADQSLIDRD